MLLNSFSSTISTCGVLISSHLTLSMSNCHMLVVSSQPSRDLDEEKDTESTLTTLFPGQKKRVSHFVTKVSVSFPLDFPLLSFSQRRHTDVSQEGTHTTFISGKDIKNTFR